YVSFNNGSKWQSLQLNLPITPVHDLVVKDNDLVLATHGRSFWVLDDVTPLRQYSDPVAQKDFFLDTPAPGFRIQAGGKPERHLPKGVGHNPPVGAIIYYFLKDAPKPGTE